MAVLLKHCQKLGNDPKRLLVRNKADTSVLLCTTRGRVRTILSSLLEIEDSNTIGKMDYIDISPILYTIKYNILVVVKILIYACIS